MPQQEGQLLDLGPELGLALCLAVVVAAGTAIRWAASRWPRAVAVALGVVAAAGVWSIWSAADAVEAGGIQAGWVRLRAGQWALALAVPGWAVVAVARQANRAVPRQREPAGWAGTVAAYGLTVAAYGFLCAVVAVLIGLVIRLGTASPGEFR